MKKRNVNRIILLIMLLFGVVGCKEPPAVSEPTSNEEPTSQISEETPSEDQRRRGRGLVCWCKSHLC